MKMKRWKVMLFSIAIVLGTTHQIEAKKVWEENFSSLKIGKWKNNVEVVKDNLAPGGKSVLLKYPGKADFSGTLIHKSKLRLSGPVNITFYVKGKGLGDLRKTIQFWTVITNEKTKENYECVVGFYKNLVSENQYEPVSVDCRLPSKPAEYTVYLRAKWGEQPEGKKPELLLSEFILTDLDNGRPYISELNLNKTCYHPGEVLVIKTTLVNPGKENFEGRLVIDQHSGLYGVENLETSDVELSPGEIKDINFEFSTGNQENGRELCMGLQDKKARTLGEAKEYFCVGKDSRFFQTLNTYDNERGHQHLHGHLYVSPASREEEAGAIRYINRRKITRYEFFSWSWCELAGFIPPVDEDPYIGSEGRWWLSLKKYRHMVEGFQDKGVWLVSYASGLVWGDAAYKLFQEHPEWFLYNRNGRILGSFNMAHHANYQRRREFDFVLHKYPFFYGMLNPVLPECRRWIADQFIDIAKRLNFRGARWDVWSMEIKPGMYDMFGKEVVPNWKEADRLTVESMQAVKELVAEKYPDFTWGYNYGAPEENENTPETIKEKCRNQGWILDEVTCTYQSKTSPYHKWEKYRDRMIGWGDFIRRHDGIYNPFKLGGAKYEIDQLYTGIFQIIGSGRSYGHYENISNGIGRLGELPFRFSDVYLGKNLRLLPRNQEITQVKADRPVWWDTMVHETVSAEGCKQIIVHLVNPPFANEIEENPENIMRPPVKNIEVVCNSIDGNPPKKVFLLMAESFQTGKPPKTQAVPLKMETSGTKSQVTVPEVVAFKTVVFEF